MKNIKYLILTLSLVMGFGLALIPAHADAAIDPLSSSCAGDAKDTTLCKDRNKDNFSSVVGTIVNSLLYILAAVAVIVIIIAGITYTTSGGDAALVTKAKNTLLYAVVGLVVAILAYAIVNYVINAFK
jgi:glucan phosphoethanolaminetransferase (alkaline phosphatase superfamily)